MRVSRLQRIAPSVNPEVNDKWYNTKRFMKTQENSLMGYSAAYPTGRELMRELRNDAPEKLCFVGKVAECDDEVAHKGPRAERCQEDGLVRRLSKRLFWDVSIESIEENTHKRFIVQRVLERGGVKDIRQLISHYSLPVVAEEAREIRSLDPVTLSFASCLINQPEESFKCYTSRQ